MSAAVAASRFTRLVNIAISRLKMGIDKNEHRGVKSAMRFEMQHVSNMNLCQNRCARNSSVQQTPGKLGQQLHARGVVHNTYATPPKQWLDTARASHVRHRELCRKSYGARCVVAARIGSAYRARTFSALKYFCASNITSNIISNVDFNTLRVFN
ncbi:hypothetical protein PUN28_012228 [Cardiocondyla obscurior]|uniref:Uncharacterized protein n=1 Tax=Cardiocondyla obscurior TaxID=286306 RepID=A0AAW2FBD8_9HYME